MTESPVIDPGEGNTNLRLLDTCDAESYAAGHAPGAVRLSVEDWVAAARTPEGNFANTGFWTDAINTLGIGPMVWPEPTTMTACAADESCPIDTPT